MALKLAFLATKFRLSWTVPSLNVLTFAAFLRGVARVNKPYRDTSSLSFVRDKKLELSKTPTM